jgi:hypothetical protein
MWMNVLQNANIRDNSRILEAGLQAYDSEANTLKFEIIAENATSIGGLPSEFEQSTLVIDTTKNPRDDWNAGG